MEQPSQKPSRQDRLRHHLLKAQEEYRVAQAAVIRAQREIDVLPAAGGHFALREALQRETRAVQRVGQMLKESSDLLLGKDDARAQEGLSAVNRELLRANEDLNQFAFATSHDLQGPLRMITNYSQLLLKRSRDQLSEEAAKCVEFISEGTNRMQELIADLLAYTQLSSDAQELIESIDLNLVFRKVLENCKAAIHDSGASVTSDYLPRAHGYEPHFVQLFQNLIGNALKYRGEQTPRVHVSAINENGIWRLAVADNGIGIDPTYHSHIFGVFKRLHDKTIHGTGMGLAICQRVVERYGGRIWVESQVNQGATFYFTLPVAKGAAAWVG